MARAVRGDAEAFGDLYERYLDDIYRYIYCRVNDACETEDLTEAVFLRAWEALDRYDAGALHLRALLYRIAHNLVVDRHRARKDEAAIDGAAEPSAPAHEEPEARLLARERTAQLAAALERLDPAQRQVVSLRFVAGMSHAETARIVGKSDGAVRVLQHRALAALRAMLGKGSSDGS